MNLPGPPEYSQKFTINKRFHLQDTLDNTPLSENEIQKIFLPNTETVRRHLLQK